MIDGVAINYQALQFWFTLINAIITAAIGLYVWSTNRHKATAAEIKEVRQEMQGMQMAQSKNCGRHWSRTTALESSVKGMPTHADIGAVYDRVNTVQQSVDTLDGKVSGISTNVILLVEHHLKGNKE